SAAPRGVSSTEEVSIMGLRNSIATTTITLSLTLATWAAPDDKAIERFQAFAVNLNAGRSVRAGQLDIVIERWSTDAEVKALTDTLKEKGAGSLLGALQKLKPR